MTTMNENQIRTPVFSVVIPTFNRSRLVAYAVDSILKQTFDDVEIVVCDNCSIDDTREVVGRIADPRVRYVRTPEHWVIADSWEFARSQAIGKFIVMLSDDDALVPTALETFARETRRHDADFLFCGVAEYRDDSFPGPGRNTLSCPPFSGSSRLVPAEEFLRPLFSFKGRFNMHPSAFVFAAALADLVASRCGRFFQTNGVEYCAWPLSAALARRIVYIDAPLCICGRTGASWGSNLALANPGQDRIEAFIADVERQPKCAPLTNFTMCNLWADGVLTAKKLLPVELGGYEFDEALYLRATMRELSRRRSLGVNVEREMRELSEYVRRWPSLSREMASTAEGRDTLWRPVRSLVAAVGARALRRRVRASRNARKVNRGEVASGFQVSGGDFGFHGIVGCAQFLGGVVGRAR
jgi:glycosyltransferase involved in cell wall biosynthesis